MPAFAPCFFTGGPNHTDTATTVANDHAAYATRTVAAAGLAADTTDFAKLRLTPNPNGG